MSPEAAELESITTPDVVVALAGGDTITPVWKNQVGGLTFRLDNGRGTTRYVKWVAAENPHLDLAAEAERLSWAQRWIQVPHVLDFGSDDDGAWLVTSAVAGRSAVDPRWAADPKTAATAIGHGLRILHDALPVDDCPFDWSVDARLARARASLTDDAGLADRFSLDRYPGVTDPEARVASPPPVDRMVVCHGDACAPNTMLHDDGTFAAHVDLDNLGTADRWADLTVGAWSTEWNYGPGYEHVVYEAYGVEPDPERIAYYRLLWDLT
ncbi:aminoglycoside 3'-phosphotransferase [Phytoactinopolyspora halotolerans]|uniref:Aminoglycoside 3'-phosphotransferase n=1 Tax=Phytoactinopolyspora halotolerans TaxID=1981512 RepID=A0A6L9SJM9_9ACTN|nr:aminoglycoside 3'-phosphotransferase [Phytoactinopolyspora halotolerans]